MILLGLSVKDYAFKEGHTKVVNQLAMQKMSLMARSRSQENVLDDLNDQINETQVQKNNQNTIDAQIIEVKKEEKDRKSGV